MKLPQMPISRHCLGVAWQAVVGQGQSAVQGLTSRAPFGEPDARQLRSEVAKLYGRVASDPGGEFHFHRGPEYAARQLGYDRAALAALPASSTRSFAGVGNPHIVEALRPGDVVLDVGCGAGTDLLLAARQVGPTGRAIGVDMTEEMLELSRAGIAELGLENVEVRRGDAEQLPLDDASVDVVISNGALNLVPDKERAFGEIFRVLRPGGRVALSDTVMSSGLGPLLRRSTELWTLCVGGALQEKVLVELMRRTGFEQVRVTRRFDCARGTPKEAGARWLRLHGVNLFAAKPVSVPAPAVASPLEPSRVGV